MFSKLYLQANLRESLKQNNELLVRALTGLSFVTVMIAATLINKYTYGFIFLVVTVISSYEFYKITGLESTSKDNSWVLLFVNVMVFLLGFFIAVNVLPAKFRIFGIIPVFLLFSTGIWGKSAPNFKVPAILISGHAYIGIPLMLLSYIYIHKQDIWPSYVIAILTFVWASDTGAYITGRLLGKHKFVPKVSPKKTWEGFLGGLVFAMLAGYIFSFYSYNLTQVQWIFMSLLVGIGATFGDLIGSSLKRTFSVKDSGHFFPGHGGFIDRFDSFFIAIVFAFVYLSLLGEIMY